MNAVKKRNRQIENAVFLIPFVTYAYFYQGSDQSIAARFDLMRSMLEKGTLWIDDFCGFNTADIIKFGPHIYSVKAPGTSFTALIPWAAIKLLLSPLQANHEEMFWAFTTYLTTLLTVGLMTALMCLVMYRFARFLGASEGRAAGVAIILGLATIAFPYATELTGEPVAGVTSFCGFYLVATFSKRSSSMRAFFGGFLAGWAVLNDYPVFLAAAAIGIYALFKLPRWKDLAAFSAGAAITAIILFAYNWGAFGSPFFFSYQAFKLPENGQFPEQAVGFVGLTYPKIRILWNILLDPQRGLFFCNPVLLLTIPATAYLARIPRWRAEFAVTVFAFVALILFNASYGESIVSWGGGTATGPRQIVAAIPFMVLTLAFLPPAWDYLLGAIAVASAAIMLMATATNPHFPYEYENPVRDFALQQFMRGDFATNRDAFFGGAMLFGESIAFNLGTLLRLPGPLQLWPLAAWWIIGAVDFAESLQLWGRKTTRHLIAVAVSIAIASIFLLSMSATILQPYELSRPNGLLGRYMVGDNCTDGPPHIVRVDSQLDFANIGHMGAMPFPSCTVWKGQLIAPADGVYHFAIDVDDSGWVTIDGVKVIHDPGNTSKPHDEGTVHLTPGRHLIEVGERNLAGDAYIRLFWQPPGAGGPEIIPSMALIPARLDHAAR